MRKNLFVLFLGAVFMMGATEGWANLGIICLEQNDQSHLGILPETVPLMKLTPAQKTHFRQECNQTYRSCGNNCDVYPFKK